MSYQITFEMIQSPSSCYEALPRNRIRQGSASLWDTGDREAEPRNETKGKFQKRFGISGYFFVNRSAKIIFFALQCAKNITSALLCHVIPLFSKAALPIATEILPADVVIVAVAP